MLWAGILGLLAISAGIIIRNREFEDVLYAVGGLFLLIYSIHIDDMVFVTLQVVFIFAAIYDFARLQWFEK